MDKTETRTFDLDFRAASDGVIPAVLSTDVPVPRSYGNEILSHEPGAINMERFPLPVIQAHNQCNIPIGVAENPRIDGGKLRSDIRFGHSDQAKAILADVQAGIIRSLSVGYRIDQAEERGSDLIATAWTPFEASVVACPADVGAGFYRSLNTQEGQRKMEEENKEVLNEALESKPEIVTAPEAPTVDARAAAELVTRGINDALATERARVKGIRLACRSAKLDEAFADDLIERGVALPAAQAQVIEKWGQSMATETGHISIGRDEKMTRREGVINALANRLGSEDLNDNGRQYRAESFLDMCSVIVPRQIGESKSTYATRVMSTSDVPNILANVMNKSLLQAYQEAPKTFEPFITRTTVNDFKTNTVTNTSNWPDLAEVPELVDYTEGAFSDKKETYTAKSYGRMLQFSRQMMINDDLGALNRMLTTAGFAVARLEATLVYGILTANAAMADTVALFHATHANLGTAGAPSDTTFAEAFKKFRLQTGIGGELLNLTPKYIVAPAALENTIRKQMSSIYAATVANQNIYAAGLEPIFEARLDSNSATAWYLIADPRSVDTIYLATISGQAPIITEEMYDFDNGAWKIKVVADRAVAAIDHRGMFKNAG